MNGNEYGMLVVNFCGHKTSWKGGPTTRKGLGGSLPSKETLIRGPMNRDVELSIYCTASLTIRGK